MSAPGPESIPTSADPRSKRALKRRKIPVPNSPTSLQAATLSSLFAKPDQEIRLPSSDPSSTKRSGLPPPPEIVTNVQGSSAGAGSGEFHVYKAARRREYERQRLMDEEVAREKAAEEFEKSKREKETRDEEKTRKNREKREKKKAKALMAAAKGKKENDGKKDDGEAAAEGTAATTTTTTNASTGTTTTPANISTCSSAAAGVNQNTGKGNKATPIADNTPTGGESGLLIIEDDDD